MATAKEYFEKATPHLMRVHMDHTLTAEGDAPVPVVVAMGIDIEGASKYSLVYVPDVEKSARCAAYFLQRPELLVQPAEGMEISQSMGTVAEPIQLSDAVFTKRVFIYTAAAWSADIKAVLTKIAEQSGLQLVVRDAEYVAEANRLEKPEAFISHDTRDKAFVRKIAEGLLKVGRSVWYDEYTLVAGQSLRESIERGIKECHKCIVVFSPSFFSNGGWTKAEFDSVFTREIVEQRRVILPVWHDVSREDVYNYSPRMADVVGIPSTLNEDQLLRELVRALDFRQP